MLRRPASRAAVLGVALGGVLIGHEIAYAILLPSATVRHAVLASTGHGYLGFVDTPALAVGIASLAALFLGRLGRRREEPSFRELVARLAGFQVLAFATIELVERIGAGAPLNDLVRILPVGGLVQVVVAAVAALLLRALLRAADAAAELLASPAPAPRWGSIPLVVPAGIVPAPGVPLGQRGRAPPTR
jgi:hypothetical protein